MFDLRCAWGADRTVDSKTELTGRACDSPQVDLHFMKKIPEGAEASNVLVGELDFLERPIVAFVRLSPAVLLTGLTEVPIPTRFDHDIKTQSCEFHNSWRSREFTYSVAKHQVPLHPPGPGRKGPTVP